MENVTIVDHPLIQHKLTLMRMRDTSSMKFRSLLYEISGLLAYEITRDCPTQEVEIETPIAKTSAPMLAGKKPTIVSILRAGNGLAEGILQLMPNLRVGHIGLYRDKNTDSVIEYYRKFPNDIAERQVILADPMVATGSTAVIAVNRLKEIKVKKISLLCLLATQQGIEYFQAYHPEIKIYTAAIDKGLTEQGYITPGVGDAGDRLFGTL